MTSEMPKLVLFEDDRLMQMCWEMKRKDEGLDTLIVFHSWEDFVARGSEDDLKGAVVFVGFRYEQGDSKYNGIQMAEMLRKRPISKLFGISNVPSYFDGAEYLFTAILPGNLPNVRRLLGVERPLRPPVKLALPVSRVYFPQRQEGSREWATR